MDGAASRGPAPAMMTSRTTPAAGPLTALVSGAAAGVVREVIIADAGSRDATLSIAEEAGCRLVPVTGERGVGLKAGADAARSPWLLFLQPGTVPDASWVDETRLFIELTEAANGSRRAATFRTVAMPFSPPLAEIVDLLRTSLGARPLAKNGLLIA